MAKVSFSKDNTVQEQTVSEFAAVAVAEASAPEPSPAQVPVLRGPQPVAKNQFSDGGEEIDFSQITLPKLNLVQGIGELSQKFRAKDIVLNKALVLPQPVEIVVLAFRPRDQFAEKTEGGATGRLFDTREEVAACGGTTDYGVAESTGKPLFRPLASCALLIKKHESLKDDSMFIYELDGGKYAFALWSMVGTVYTNGAKVFRSAKKLGTLLDLRKGFCTGAWALTTDIKAFGEKKSAVIPVLKPIGPTTEAFQAAAKEILDALRG